MLPLLVVSLVLLPSVSFAIEPMPEGSETDKTTQAVSIEPDVSLVSESTESVTAEQKEDLEERSRLGDDAAEQVEEPPEAQADVDQNEAMGSEAPSGLVAVASTEESGSCGESLSYTIADGTLTISGTGMMSDYDNSSNYSSSHAPWYTQRSTINSLVVEQGVTSIGNEAFHGFDALVSVSLPKSLKSIGYGAFERCTSLQTIALPEGLTTVDNGTFSGCTSLNGVSFPKSLRSLGSRCFAECTSLSEIQLPSGLEAVPDSLFYGCASLNKLTLPEKATYLGYAIIENTAITDIVVGPNVGRCGFSTWYQVSGAGGPFDGANNLTHVTLDEGASSIPQFMFSRAGNLSDFSVTLPSTVAKIEDRAFYYCMGLKSIDLTNIPQLASLGEEAFEGCRSLTDVRLSQGITSIDHSCFENCSLLENLSLPASLTTLGGKVLKGTRVSSIVIPARLEKCGGDTNSETSAWREWAAPFAGATQLREASFVSGTTRIPVDVLNGSTITNVTIPGSVVSVGAGAFLNCASLASVTLPQSVTEIGRLAFKGCSSLSALAIPPRVTTLGEGFVEGTAIRSAVVPSSVVVWARAFRNCTELSEVSLPQSLVTVPEGAFSGCTALSTIELPVSLQSIGKYAFEGCTVLTQIALPSGLVEIGDRAFSDCKSLVSVSLPLGLKSIGNGAFWGCTSITSVTIPPSVTSGLSNAFGGCTSLQTAWIGHAVDSLYGSFYGCTALKDVTLAEGTQELWGDNTFEGCTSLLELTIPASVTKMDCDLLKKSSIAHITFARGSESVPENAFSGVRTITNVTLPSTVREIGSYAFNACDALATITLESWSRLCSVNSYAFGHCTALSEVWFGNTQERWDQVKVSDGSNDALRRASIHVNSGTRPFDLVLDTPAFIHSNDPDGHSAEGYMDQEDPLFPKHFWKRAYYGFWGVEDYTGILSKDKDPYLKRLCSSDKNSFRKGQHEPWAGDCFGLSMAIALAYEGDRTLLDRDNARPQLFCELEPPYGNAEALSLLNLYQLTQYFAAPTSAYYSGDGSASCNMTLLELVSAVHSDGVAVFCVGTPSKGHALLAFGYHTDSNGSPSLYVYDVNAAGERYMNVKGNGPGRTFATDEDALEMHLRMNGNSYVGYSLKVALGAQREVAGSRPNVLTEENSKLEVYTVQTLRGLLQADTRGSNFDRIVFGIDPRGFRYGRNGSTVTADLSGSLRGANGVRDDWFVSEGNDGRRIVTIEDADDYHLESDDNGCELEVASPDVFYSVKTQDASSIDINKKNGVMVKGGRFSVSYGDGLTVEDSGLLTISGNADGQVHVQPDGKGGIDVQSDEGIKELRVTSIDGQSEQLQYETSGISKLHISKDGATRTLDVSAAHVYVPDQVYNGDAITPAVSVKIDGKELVENTDYVASYMNNTASGTATVTITGIGGYAGSNTTTFRIAKAPNTLSATARIAKLRKTYSATKSQIIGSNVAVSKAQGKLIYDNVSSGTSGGFVVDRDSGAITIPAGVAAGNYEMKLRVSAAGDENHEAGNKTVSFIVGVAKAANPMLAKAKKKTIAVKWSKVQKRTQIIARKKVFVVRNPQGKVTYKKSSGNKKISISKNGKVSVKKGLKKGMYKVKVNVIAAGNANYAKAIKSATFKIKVR